MSGKQSKKLRQLYRRDLGQQAKKHSEEVQAKLSEFTEQMDKLLKPNPRFIPAFVWVSFQRIFLNI